MNRARIHLLRCTWLVLAGLALTAHAQSPASAAAAPSSHLAQLAIVQPVVSCSKLQGTDISGQVGATTHIESASEVTTGSPAPYCKVTGYVEPAIRFEVRLPLSSWTQRFVQTGCGGLCGSLNIHLNNDAGCYPAQHGELALASTDMGHEGENDGQWGGRDYQLRIDFAYRGVHLTTLAAKALIAAFYGQAARFSYFSGCSDGGREALMEAQRFPADFNGILAGDPAMNFTTQNTFYHGWNAVRNVDASGNPILTADKLPILHKAAMDACDAADGLKDGLISDPLSCHFDPAVVQCKPGQNQDSCLTPAQVQVARDIYDGAHDTKGDKLVIGGPLPGSELAWAGLYVPTAGATRLFSNQIATGTLKYLAYEKDPDASYTLKDLQFTPASFKATTELHGLYDSTDPNLTPFESRGGKLILYHGLADQHISPLNTIAYYTAMDQTMGAATVQKFARLYLFPGGYHCGGGEGPFDVDLLSAIMGWVEGNDAPSALIASHSTGGQGPGGPGAGGPQPARTVDRTRPVYPYPFTAKYTGTGSIDEARNFVEGPAKPVNPDRLKWLGSGFYSSGYEVACKANGTTMSCEKTH